MKKQASLLLLAIVFAFFFTACEKNYFTDIDIITNIEDTTACDPDSVIVHDTIHVGGGPVIGPVDPCSRPHVSVALFTEETEAGEDESVILAGMNINVDTCCVKLKSAMLTFKFLSGDSDDLADFVKQFSFFDGHSQLAVVSSNSFQNLGGGQYRLMVDLNDFTICNGITTLKLSVETEDDMNGDTSSWEVVLNTLRVKDNDGEVYPQTSIIVSSTTVTFD